MYRYFLGVSALDRKNLKPEKELIPVCVQRCFFFFFFLAVLGYLSVMISGDPYNDDYCRYFTNTPVGTSVGLRHITFLLERIMYLSSVTTDAAPLTQLISCAILACTSILCAYIFEVNFSSRIEVLCLFPIVVNPYLLEVMMYRFDSPFIIFALFLTTLAAYFSSFSSRKLLFTQTTLLFLSLFVYQAAISAYFIILLYTFMRKFEKNSFLKNPLRLTFFEMRYWFYSLVLCALFYLPFTGLIEYCKSANEGLFIIPDNLENLIKIAGNIGRYFLILYNDWSVNLGGQTLIFMAFTFVIGFLTRAGVRTRSFSSVLIFSGLVFLLFLAPSGMYAFLHMVAFKGNASICPRILYSIGILLALILRDNYLMLQKIFIGRFESITEVVCKFYKIMTGILCLWSLIFTNSVGNLVHRFQTVQQLVIHDISKDIFDITRDNKNISRVCVVGSITSPIFMNFSRIYPIIDRIIPEKWCAPTYFRLATLNPDVANAILTLEGTSDKYKEGCYRTRVLEKDNPFYRAFILDGSTLLFELNQQTKWKSPVIPYITLK